LYGIADCRHIFPTLLIVFLSRPLPRNMDCMLAEVALYPARGNMAYLQPERGVVLEELLLKCHQLEKELAAAAELSVDEFHCLTQLYAHTPCCVKKLSEVLGTKPKSDIKAPAPSRRTRIPDEIIRFRRQANGNAGLDQRGRCCSQTGVAILNILCESIGQLAPGGGRKVFTSSLGCDDPQAMD